MRTRRNRLGLFALLAMLTLALTVLPAFAAAEDPTELTGTKYIECPDCGTMGVVLSDEAGPSPANPARTANTRATSPRPAPFSTARGPCCPR